MLKRVLPMLLCVLFLAAFQFWPDENKIGEVQSVRGGVVAVAEGQKRSLSVKDSVFERDLLAVGEEGFLQIMFKDGTVLTMSENSEMELRQFAYEVGNAENSLVDLNMLSGGMRFLTGKSTKSNPEGFKVETPLGTIGIRGTEGTAVTGLDNEEDYANGLNASINSPGTAWSPGVPPSVTSQTVNHVDGSASRAMTFTDRFGKTVSMDRGQGVDVSREQGAGEPRSNPEGTASKTTPTSFNKQATTPKEYRSKFGGYEGGGRPGANSSSQGGHDPAATTSSHESEP